jgi:hypothetical protein
LVEVSVKQPDVPNKPTIGNSVASSPSVGQAWISHATDPPRTSRSASPAIEPYGSGTPNTVSEVSKQNDGSLSLKSLQDISEHSPRQTNQVSNLKVSGFGEENKIHVCEDKGRTDTSADSMTDLKDYLSQESSGGRCMAITIGSF